MKTTKLVFIALLLFLFSFQSCFYGRAGYKSIDRQYFGNIEVKVVNEPYIKKRFSLLPIGASFGGALMFSNMYLNTEIESQLSISYGFLGLTAAMIVQQFFPFKADYNRVEAGVKASKRLSRKDNENYIYIVSDNKHILFPSSAANGFTADKPEHITFYYNYFKDSQMVGDFILRTAKNADDKTLLELIKLFYAHKEIVAAKRSYVMHSTTYNEFQSRQNNFPKVLSQSDEMAMYSELIENYSQFAIYQTRYGKQTSYENAIFSRLYKLINVYADLLKLIEDIPYAIDINNARNKAIEIAPNVNALVDLKMKFGADFRPAIEKKGASLVYNDPVNNFNSYFTNFGNSSFVLNDSFQYIGVHNGQANGSGVKRDGDEYWVGTFSDGELKGKGKYFGNHTYEGEFNNGEKNGFGIAKGYNGKVPVSWLHSSTPEYIEFEGKWVDGLPDYGKLVSPKTGMWYEGDFLMGRFDGNGTIRFPEATRVTGNWTDHQPNGSMKFEVWTLMGLIKQTEYYNCYSWEDINKYRSIFNNEWRQEWSSTGSSSYSSSSTSKEDNKEQQEIILKAKNVSDCISEIEKKLVLNKSFTTKEQEAWGNGSCVLCSWDLTYVYESSVWTKKGWYLHTTFGDTGPFTTKHEAIEALCKKRFE